MNSEKQDEINPFAFQSETNTRFRLFIVFIILIIMGDQTYSSFFLPPNSSDQIVKLYQIQNQAYFYESQLNQSMISGADYSSISISTIVDLLFLEFDRYFISLNLIWLRIFGGILFVIAFFVGFHLYQKISLRGKECLIIKRENDPLFFEHLNKIFYSCKLDKIPFIAVTRNREIGGQVIPWKNSVLIKLEGQMRLLFRKNIDNFNLIILHEIAHISNQDIRVSISTLVYWNTFIAFLVFPIIHTFQVIFENNNSNNPGVFWILHQIISWLIIVFLSLAFILSVFHSKELLADWRLTIWGYKDAILNKLNNSLHSKHNLRAFFSNVFHPHIRKRISHIYEPIRFFSAPLSLFFLTGLIIGISLTLINAIEFPLDNIALGIGKINYYIQLIFFYLFGGEIKPVHIFIFDIFDIFIIWSREVLNFFHYLIPAVFGAVIFGNTIKRTIVGNILKRNNFFQNLKEDTSIALVCAIGSQLGLILHPTQNVIVQLIMAESSFFVFFLYFICGTMMIAMIYFGWFSLIRLLMTNLIGNSYSKEFPKIINFIISTLSCLIIFPWFSFMIDFEDLFATLLSGITSNTEVMSITPWFDIYSAIHDLILKTNFILLGTVILLIFSLSIIFFRNYVKEKQIQRCPMCNYEIDPNSLFDSFCPHCSQRLNRWLFQRYELINNL